MLLLALPLVKRLSLKKLSFKLATAFWISSEVDANIANFKDAIAKTVDQLEAIRDKAAAKLGEEEAEVFEGHILVATDEELEEEVIEAIKGLKPADAALSETIAANVAMLAALDDPYLRERVADIKDVGRRMVKNLLGIDMASLEDVDHGFHHHC